LGGVDAAAEKAPARLRVGPVAFGFPKDGAFRGPQLGERNDKSLLVGGLEHDFYDFPYIGNVIIPTDFHIFQRGRYTTNQSLDLEVRLKIWNANSSTILMFFVIFRKRHGYKLEVQARSRLASTWCRTSILSSI